MQYIHLNLEEREKLYALREQGKSFRQISLVLNRSHTTLAREYRRYAKYGRPSLPCPAKPVRKQTLLLLSKEPRRL